MRKVVLAIAMVGALVSGAFAQSPSFAASKKPLQVVVTGPSTASVTHSYSAKISLGKRLSGFSCTGYLNGQIKIGTTGLNAAGKGNLVVGVSFFKQQYKLGKRLAVLTVSCSSSKYAGTSAPVLLNFVR